MNGRPLTLAWESEHCAAILETWFGGTEAGNATAAVLFGDYNPSGRLTATFPRNTGQIPIYYNHKNTGRPRFGQSSDKYRSRYLDVPNDPSTVPSILKSTLWPCNPMVRLLLQKNFHSRFGEIDLIMQDKDTVVFVEDVDLILWN